MSNSSVRAAFGAQADRLIRDPEQDIQSGHSVPPVRKRIWIDFDNSPHVPFFLPIIDELHKIGYDVFLTARNSYQVCDLLKFHHISCPVIAGHWGRHKVLKVLGTLLRAVRLLPVVMTRKIDLALSHGSRSQLVSSAILGIPTIMMADYEFIAKVGALKPDWLFLPQFIPDSSDRAAKRQVMKYPGLKEDVYVPRFRPDASLRAELGVGPNEIIVTVRPPATEAHYHNPEAEVLLERTLQRFTSEPGVKVILLPRNERQEKLLRSTWAKCINEARIIIPSHVVDGLNLIWCSDLVVSGGGTMNREAAALGVPVYSIFRGRIGGVDRYLARSGRLVLIEKPEEIQTKIVLKRRNTLDTRNLAQSAALKSIVCAIVSIAERGSLPGYHH